MQRGYDKAIHASSLRGKRAYKGTLDEEEMARSNLRAFERIHGLDSPDRRLA